MAACPQVRAALVGGGRSLAGPLTSRYVGSSLVGAATGQRAHQPARRATAGRGRDVPPGMLHGLDRAGRRTTCRLPAPGRAAGPVRRGHRGRDPCRSGRGHRFGRAPECRQGVRDPQHAPAARRGVRGSPWSRRCSPAPAATPPHGRSATGSAPPSAPPACSPLPAPSPPWPCPATAPRPLPPHPSSRSPSLPDCHASCDSQPTSITPIAARNDRSA
jgi:hypothetical protein